MNPHCPVTKMPCARSCTVFGGDCRPDCELEKLKNTATASSFQRVLANDTDRRHAERRKEFARGKTYFIASEHLGVIEGATRAMLASGLKRSRRVEFNHIQQVLKTLKLIPVSEKIVSLGLGSLDTGDTGLLVLCSSPHQVQGDIPNSGGNYASERKDSTS